MNIETLYLTIAPGRRYNQVRIAKVSKRKPTVKIGHALVKLEINLPSGVLQPPKCVVEIKPEHISQTPVKVTSQQP